MLEVDMNNLEMLALLHRLQAFLPGAIEIDARVTSLLDDGFAWTNRAVVIMSNGNNVTIAIDNPEDDHARDLIHRRFEGKEVKLLLTTFEAMTELLNQYHPTAAMVGGS